MMVIIFYSLIFGVLVTLFGYSWGSGNHSEQIPIILRVLDPNFLKNDFFTNSAFLSGQRLYYAYILAFFTKILTLKYAYLLLTFLVNTFNVFIISLFVYKIFKSQKAAIIASFLATQSLIEIGGATFLTSNQLIPQTLAVSFALLGVYFGFFVNPFLSAISFSIASFIHPLLGIETGFLCLGLWILTKAFIKKQAPIKDLKKIVLSFLPFFLSFYYLFFKSYQGINTLSDQEFVYIIAYFRHPHHYLFSAVDKLTWLIMFSFIFSMLIVIFKLLKRKELKKFLLFSFLAIVFVLAVVSLGFYFTEVKPTKFIVAAQVLRIFYFLKFLGIVLIAGFSSILENQGSYLLSLFSPITIFYYFIFDLFKKISSRFLNLKKEFLEALYYLGLIFIAVWLIDVARFSRISLIFLGALFFYLLFYESKRNFYFLSFLLTIFLIFIVSVPSSRFIFQKWFSEYRPKFEISYIYPEMPFLSEFVKKHAAKNDVFLTPADFGQFRFLAQRAIVVDFKGFLFNEKMKEWYERIVDVYGKPKKFYYYEVIDELNENYKKIDDKKLLELKRKYNFDYALLFKETKTRLPVVYKYGNFKIVSLKEFN